VELSTTTETEHLMSIERLESAATALPLGVWRVDPATSRVGFDVRHMWGLGTVRGEFEQFRGTLVSQEEGASGHLSIEAASLTTNNAKRDEHLRSADFFDVERHPDITFTEVAVSDHEEGVTVVGELRIRDVGLRLELPTTVEDRGDRIVLRTATAFAREDAGLAWNKAGMIRGDAKVALELELVRED
jgi:polyisoprenoid-binding protein YceI